VCRLKKKRPELLLLLEKSTSNLKINLLNGWEKALLDGLVFFLRLVRIY